MVRASSGEVRLACSHPGTAQEPRRRPTQGPREAQDRPTQRHPDTPGSDFQAILKRFWYPQDLEKLQKVLYCQRFSRFPRSRKGAFNRGPQSSKRSPPGGPNEPQVRPGCPRSGPRAPKTAPRGARSAPRRAQDHPGPLQERTQGAPSRPDASREPVVSSPFWPHLGAPGA